MNKLERQTEQAMGLMQDIASGKEKPMSLMEIEEALNATRIVTLERKRTKSSTFHRVEVYRGRISDRTLCRIKVRSDDDLVSRRKPDCPSCQAIEGGYR